MSHDDLLIFHAPQNDSAVAPSDAKLGRRAFGFAGVALTAASLMTLASGVQAQHAKLASGVSRNRAALDRYYTALQKKDAAALRSAVENGFAADAVLRISDSLPYGGTHVGRTVILEMLMGFVTATAPIIRPEQIKIEGVVEEGDSIVAKAVFPWLAPGAREPIPMSAYEWFTFRDGRITEMTVSYWDTAACLAAMKAAGTKS